MTDIEDEGEWSPWEKEETPTMGQEEEEEEEENGCDEEQSLIVTTSHPLQASQDMDGSTQSLLGGAPSLLPQYITAAIATLGAFSMGCVLGYSSPAGPMLMSNSTNSPFVISASQNNWFGSSMNVGALIGGLTCGFGLSYLGRKGTMQISVVPYLCGWGLMAFASNFTMLIAGRIMTGFCCGISSSAITTYIGEFSSAKIRGTLGAGFQLMVTLGLMYAMTVGAFLSSWQLLAGLCAIPPALYFLLLFFVKESPVYLLTKGKDEAATASLQYFRGKHYNVQTELDMLRDAVEEAKRNKASLRDLLVPSTLKPLLISLALMFFQQFSGVNPVLFNLATIFSDAGSSMSPASSSIIIAAVQVAATFLAVVLMDKAGRKLLLIASSSVMALSLVALGVFFYLKNEDESWAVSTLGFLPLVSLIVFILSFSYGYGPIPWLMMGELFPSNVREIAASVATFTNWTLSLTVTLIFLPLKESIGDYGVYWAFSAVCVVNLIFCVTVVPETKGKTLEEITAYFGGGRRDSSHRRL